MTVLVPKPELPASVLHWLGEESRTIPPTFGEVVVIPIVHDWGPMGSEVPLRESVVLNYPQFVGKFGNGDTPGHDAIAGALLGMGVTGGGGAGGVIPYRMATGAAAEATATLDNTAAADSLVLTAIYKGTRGNDISVVHEDDPASAGNDRLRVLFQGATIERYTYPEGDVAALAAAINARPSAWVTAASPATGVALAHGTFPLGGGNNGDVLTAAEWLSAQTALEFAEAGIFSPFNLVDVGIKAQLRAWLQTMAQNMLPMRGVFGGAADETVDAAIADAALARDEHLIRLGVGVYHDDMLGKDLSTAQLAPRAAGVLAARGLKSSLTNADFGGLSPVGDTLPDYQELVALRNGGVTSFKRVNRAESELAIAEGVTTFNARNVAGKPYELFSEPRIIGLLDTIQRRITKWGDERIVGDVTNTQDTRDAVQVEVTNVINEYVADNLIEPAGIQVYVHPSGPGGDDSTIPYEFGFKPTRTVKYLVGQGRVR
ncbi:MAG TPA: hypothetical protein VF192_01275 [Longimicrobiales bacterium]